LVSEVSSERNATASLRTALQPGFWEDPKRMRPLGTQRPERPKSELCTTNTKNAALARLLGRVGLRQTSVPPEPPMANRLDSQPHRDLHKSRRRELSRIDSAPLAWRSPSEYSRPALMVPATGISRAFLCYDSSEVSTQPMGKRMSTITSDSRAVPAGEPKPIIPPLASFYSHARDLSWLVVRLTAGARTPGPRAVAKRAW